MNFGEINNYDSKFEVEFSDFKGTKEAEYSILEKTFIKISEDFLVFELVDANKRIEPLELIIKFISNKTVGDITLKLNNSDDEVLGKIKLNKLLFTKINGLIDFAFDRENKDKTIEVSYECNDIVYIGKNGKEEKIS